MKTRHTSWPLSLPVTLLAAGLGLSACGGGGGGGGGSAPPGATTHITGSAFAAPVVAGAVSVRDAAGTSIAGPVVTAADGSYAIDVPNAALQEELYFELSGGSFTDEATGLATGLSGSDGLAAVAAAGSLAWGGEVHLAPATTVIHRLVTRHGVARAAARVAFRNALGFTPDPAIAPSNLATETQASRLAGLRAASFSQLTRDLGLTPGSQFELLDALARDLSDGSLDGEDGGGPVPILGAGRDLPVDVQNRFELALLGFLDSDRNQTDLGPEQIGYLAFAKVALTDSYRVEYSPVPPGAAVGRTPFRLAVTDKATGAPVPGLGVSLRPTMQMSVYDHSTPWEPVADNGDGTYDGAVYYSMPGGEGLGTWRLEVELRDGPTAETATYHPVVGGLNVNMALLRGQEDRIQGLLGPEKRPYYVFDAGLTPLDGGAYRFDLFVSAQEDDWNYPGLSTGLTLRDERDDLWSVSAAVVEVSLDADGNQVPDADEAGGAGWYVAASGGGGLWSVPAMSGIDPSSETLAFYVRLSVNGERKTSDGQPPNGTNEYAGMVMGGASCCE